MYIPLTKDTEPSFGRLRSAGVGDLGLLDPVGRLGLSKLSTGAGTRPKAPRSCVLHIIVLYVICNVHVYIYIYICIYLQRERERESERERASERESKIGRYTDRDCLGSLLSKKLHVALW